MNFIFNIFYNYYSFDIATTIQQQFTNIIMLSWMWGTELMNKNFCRLFVGIGPIVKKIMTETSADPIF